MDDLVQAFSGPVSLAYTTFAANQNSNLLITGYGGEPQRIDGSSIEADLQVTNGALRVKVANFKQLRSLPLLKLHKKGDASFSLETLDFANTRSGAYEVQLQDLDPETENREPEIFPLDFNGTSYEVKQVNCMRGFPKGQLLLLSSSPLWLMDGY